MQSLCFENKTQFILNLIKILIKHFQNFDILALPKMPELDAKET